MNAYHLASSLFQGGHGTRDCIDEYVARLKEEFNITLIWQVAHGPECNMLDLGVWCKTQSEVEKEHQGKRTDTNVLVRTIELTWDSMDS